MKPWGGGVDSTPVSVTSAIHQVSGQNHTPGHFTPGEGAWHPLYRRLGGSQDWSGWVQKISPPPGFDLWTIQLLLTTLSQPTFIKQILLNI